MRSFTFTYTRFILSKMLNIQSEMTTRTKALFLRCSPGAVKSTVHGKMGTNINRMITLEVYRPALFRSHQVQPLNLEAYLQKRVKQHFDQGQWCHLRLLLGFGALQIKWTWHRLFGMLTTQRPWAEVR